MEGKSGQNELYSTLNEIKTMMNRSSRFLNVSPAAPIVVGIYAVVAAWTANRIYNGGWDIAPMLSVDTPYRMRMLSLAAIGLVALSVVTAALLCRYEARRRGERLTIDAAARRLIFNFALPLVVGGVLCFALLANGYYGISSSIMLVFYGMALTSASNHTFSSVRYLGYAELLLGLIDAFCQGYGLMFWTIGFGAMNIVFGAAFMIFGKRR